MPTRDELTQRAHTIARRIGRFLERQGLMERDIEDSYLDLGAEDEDPMHTLPAGDQEDQFVDTVGKVARVQ